MSKRIKILIAIIIVLLIVSIGSYFFIQYQKNENEKLERAKTVFNISQLIIYSSADATQNDTNKEPIWNLNLYQYTNIGIKINNQNDYTGEKNKNAIKELYIDNIQILEKPILGNLNFYYLNPLDFSKGNIIEENLITDNLNYDVLDFGVSLDSSKPQINKDAGIVSLQIINKDIYNDFIISDISAPVTFDGSLLKRSNLDLNNLKYKISFDINIVNNLDEKFKCTVLIDCPIEKEDSEESISNGFIVVDESNLENYKFIRVD